MTSPAVASPTLLSLDTSTERVHAALVRGDETRVVELAGGAQASVTLLPALQSLVAEAGLAWRDLDAIAFGAGPGAFTGLRTACSTAQGLALGVNKPVLALDTLMLVAESARQIDPSAWADGDEVWVLQDARMEEMYVAAYRWQGETLGWALVHDAQLWPLTEPQQRWSAQAPQHLAGGALLAYADRFVGVPARYLWAQAMPSGAAQASVALRAWHQGLAMDAALALPRYVRDKVAQTTAERQAAKA